jgi:hypothetical protein
MFNLKAPQSIFVHADGFLKASMTLEAGGPGSADFNPLCFAATVTNSAFAIVLYLKCLIQITTGQSFFKQHDLKKLFLKLPEDVKAEIAKQFNALPQPQYDMTNAPKEMQEAVAKRAKDFSEALKESARAFESWRYMYEFEKSDDLDAYSLFPLPPILRAVILERQPQWARFGFKLTKLGSTIPSTS